MGLGPDKVGEIFHCWRAGTTTSQGQSVRLLPTEAFGFILDSSAVPTVPESRGSVVICLTLSAGVRLLSYPSVTGRMVLSKTKTIQGRPSEPADSSPVCL